MEGFTNFSDITLGAGCTSGATTITLAGAYSVLPTSGTFRLIIDSEILVGTARTGASVTVVRGQEGTTAAAHALDAEVVAAVTAGALAQFKADILAAGGSVPEANRLYISTTGNDSSGDGSIGKPFATYAHSSRPRRVSASR